MSEPKKLSLTHLQRGLQLLQRIEEEETAAEMVAVYLAPADLVRRSKTEPAVLEALRIQAGDLEGEEAARILADFFGQCLRYQAATLGSLPQITAEIKAKVLAAQSPTS